MAARTPRQNTPTEQNKADNELVLYRLQEVEKKVDALGEKIDNQENIKKVDLVEFRETILLRINDKFSEIEKDMKGLQGQINDLKKDKADKKSVTDLQGLVKAGGALISSIIGALVIYYFTRGGQ